MMLLSRFWYVLLSILVGVALYVVFVAVGQYNRRNAVAMNEGLASDSQTVGWALQIDARRRLDLLLPGSVDPLVRAGLSSANGKEKIPQKSREDAHKALADIQAKFTDYRPDAIFAVDRDGRVIAEVGYDLASNDEFELGGYPAVFDALHGYLRDDTWVWGGKIYRVVARPVEEDATQPPVGAIVALRAVDAQYAHDLAKRTRTNVAFYASSQKVAAAAYDGASEKLDDASFELLTGEMPRLVEDKTYKESGRSEVRTLGPEGTLGAMFARLHGDAYDLGAGFAVVRPRVSINGPLGFLSGADDTDKKSVSWLVIIAAALLSAGIGIGFSVLEHTLPVGELANQARRMKRGDLDYFQLPRLRGGLRELAQDVNGGIERVAERGGVAVRKPADLESILGPVPAQPAMSAFSFPLPGGEPSAPPGPAAPPPFRPPQPPGMGNLAPPRPPPPVANFNAPPLARQGAALPPQGAFPAPRPNAGLPLTSPFAQTTALAAGPLSPDAYETTQAAPSGGGGGGGGVGLSPLDAQEEDEATMVGQVPADVLAAATGETRPEDGAEEWLSVYDDFIRKKRECGEAIDGLTFEKFAQTLKKNRDALMQRHGCKRVRFAVYVKEGRASLKATPIKD